MVRFAIATCVVATQLAAAQTPAPATFMGRVLADTMGRVVIGAEVTIADASLRTVTDSAGEFRLPGIPAGRHQVQIRKIGFGGLAVALDFGAGETMVRTIYLDHVNTLDSVTVKSTHLDPQMDAYEENRKRGFGEFVTTEQLRAKEGMLTESLLGQMHGFQVVRAGNEDWLVSKHTPRSQCAGMQVTAAQTMIPCLQRERVFYVPDKSDASPLIFCHPRFYLDDMLLNPGDPAPPINLRDFPPTQLEAIELYTGLSDVPPKYAGADSKCGIVVLHRRRS